MNQKTLVTYLDIKKTNMEKIKLDCLKIRNFPFRKWQTTEIIESLPLDVSRLE